MARKLFDGCRSVWPGNGIDIIRKGLETGRFNTN